MTTSEPHESQARTERPHGVTPGIIKNNLYNLENELWSLDTPGSDVSADDNNQASTLATSVEDTEPALLLEADQLPVIEEEVSVRVIEDTNLNSEDDVGLTPRRPRAMARRRRGKADDQADPDKSGELPDEERKPEHHFIPDKSSIIRPHETNIWDSLDHVEQSAEATNAETWTDEPAPKVNHPDPEVTPASVLVPTTDADSKAITDATDENIVAATEAVKLPNIEPGSDGSSDVGAAKDAAIAADDAATSPSEPAVAATAFRIPRITIAERMSLLIFAAIAFIGVIIAVVAFFRNIPAEANPYRMPDMPVKGDIVRISDARTYWRAPIRDGANADTTKADTIMLPVVEITIADCPNPNGAVRLFFRNEKNELVGDPITRSYSNMAFSANGKATLPMASTFGFNDFGAHQAYRAEKALPWKIEVFEGPNESAPRESFKKITTLPISSNQQ